MKRTEDSQKNDLNDLIPDFNQRGMNLGLDRIQMALQKIGNPCSQVPAIQIVGTNGKGSIASFIQSSLKTAGIKSGVTTSPHLLNWCERIQVDGTSISPEEFRSRLTSIKAITESNNLTPFELVIATALDHFDNNNVELLVLEAGLGGRLDATTAHPFRPIIAMADIGLDHCEYLGETLKKITQEKTAVISSGSFVISGLQHPDVIEVINQTVDRKHAKIRWVDPISKNWQLGLNGEIQRKNAAVAKGALEALQPLGFKIDEQKICEGFALANWPGRLQQVYWERWPLLIDGAHNPHAAEQLSKERNNWPSQELGVQWVLGIQSHKEAPRMLRHLLKPNDIAWIVPVPNHKSWSKLDISMACPELAKQFRQAKKVEEVFKLLLTEHQWPKPPPVVGGSLYLIGDLLKEKIISKRIIK